MKAYEPKHKSAHSKNKEVDWWRWTKDKFNMLLM